MLGRETERFLLARKSMGMAEWSMWCFFDVALTCTRAIAPVGGFCFLYLLKNKGLVKGYGPISTSLTRVLFGYFIAEFFFYVYFRMAHMFTFRKQKTKPFKSQTDRVALLNKCLATVRQDHGSFFKQWRLNVPESAPLTLSDVEHVIGFAFFEEENPRVLEKSPEFEELMNLSLSKLEKAPVLVSEEEEEEKEKTKKPKAITTTYAKFSHTDPTAISFHRPLIMLFVVDYMFQEVIGPTRMKMNGWKRMKSGDLSYFFKQGKRDKTPILFLHGIGVGIMPYLGFFSGTIEPLFKEESVFVIEMPQISQRYNPIDLDNEKFVVNVSNILNQHGYATCIGLAHSYGTFVASWFLKFPCNLKFEKLILADPACLLLHHIDVLNNMIYKVPSTSHLDRVLEFIMRSDYFFQKHLRNEFHWHENILFIEDVQKDIPLLVIVSDGDQVIPSKSILKYLEEKKPIHENMKVLILPNHAEHAEFLVHSELGGLVKAKLKEFCLL